ncbi:META domain-containing protein [Solirubrobacter phytolaccae]|uniref:META domain-containing protein n=1 Tax=Solirubrobacter phytolaccae TaxID=1404360 RepID=A0A9X3NAL3_9ACTN|nr:META domain-containing protein [Solirubrobacter phytolaccae]MDA0181252.1 META domain-containing protein [Solirubrobacter phytolaccae]
MRRLLLAVLVLAGCGGEAAQGPPALEGTPWVVASGEASASFTDGTLSGSDGCNRYTTSYTIDGDTLRLGAIVTTKMACEPARMERADAFRAALERASRWRVEDEELTLLDDAGDEQLRLRGASPLGSWTLTSFLQGDAVTGPVDGAELTANFVDGTVSGSTGCNTYKAPYTLRGKALTIASPQATEIACSRPELTEQEALYLKALPLTASYTVAGSTLTLLTKAGTIVATYARDS